MAVVAGGGLVALDATSSSAARHAPPATRAAGKGTATTAPASAGSNATSAPSSESTGTTAPTVAVPAVGSTTLSVADGTRDFTADVLYPAERPGVGVAPLGRARPWPLIVFSPGFDIAPEAYQGLVERWVTAGFVVAVADYPATAPGAPGGLDESDLIVHPADLRAVIDEILAQSAAPDVLLSGTVDPGRIGAAGHSDGGDVTEAVVADSCCRDPRIRAAAVLSGAELTSFGGTYGPPGIPLLVTQGDSDQINPPGCSQQIYDGAGPPRFYLDLRGAGHRAPYLASGPYSASAVQAAGYEEAVDQVTVLFWQGYLAGEAGAAASLRSGADVGPDATLDTGVALPRTGPCPGAPA